MIKLIAGLFLISLSQTALGDPGIEAFSVQTNEDGNQTYTLTLQIMLMMTALDAIAGPCVSHDLFYTNHCGLGNFASSAGDRPDALQSNINWARIDNDPIYHGARHRNCI